MEGHLDIFKIMLGSGPIVKIVLALLVLSSILSWAIIFKKYKMLKEVGHNNGEFLEIFHRSKDLHEVMEKGLHLPFSPFRSVFINAVTEWEKIRGPIYDPKHSQTARKHLETFGPGAIERAISKGATEANTYLENQLSTLASIGSVTPFVGLFGTVWGIINSFTGLASGGGTLEAVAPGIAEALVATAIGLAAAIPAIWFYNYFSGKNGSINSQMECFGQDLLNQIERSIVEH